MDTVGTAPPGRTPVRTIQETEPLQFEWGTIRWLCNQELMPGTQMTLGYVIIEPGKKNPLMAHPNCEELLFVISGELEHRLEDRTYHLAPGSMIRIPAGARHDAFNSGSVPAIVLVAYSAPDRQTVIYEDTVSQTGSAVPVFPTADERRRTQE